MRGDNCTVPSDCTNSAGSPPRAWGQPYVEACGTRSQRFTPTCVGTTCSRATTLSAFTVHPHVRGDNKFYRLTCAQISGSPPRAWGQHTGRGCRYRRHRFTPTCVGTTYFARNVVLELAVHPHVRGDNFTLDNSVCIYRGSPPRAWGQLNAYRGSEQDIRFTPTCVGTTKTRFHRRASRPVHPHVRGDNKHGIIPGVTLNGSPPRAWGQRGCG